MSPSILSTCLEDDPLENRDLSKFVSCPQNWSRFFPFGSLLYSCRLRQACRTKKKMFLWFGPQLALITLCLIPIVRNMQCRRPSLSVHQYILPGVKTLTQASLPPPFAQNARSKILATALINSNNRHTKRRFVRYLPNNCLLKEVPNTLHLLLFLFSFSLF